jgi:hypothetical protein
MVVGPDTPGASRPRMEIPVQLPEMGGIDMRVNLGGRDVGVA